MAKVISKTCSLVVFCVGFFSLIGWGAVACLDRDVLPGLLKMSAGTALLFVFMGLDLWLLMRSSTDAPSHKWFWKTSLFAAITAAVATLRLLGYPLHRSFGIDHLWFRTVSHSAIASRMAPPTACVFILLGLGSILRRAKLRWAQFFEAPVMLGGLVAWLGLMHYILGGSPLFSYTDMAAQTSVSFLILSAGIITARSEFGLVALMSSNTSGGLLARRLVPYTLLLPTAFGWLRLEAQRAGWFGTEAGISVFAIANLITFGGLIWANAVLLDRSDTSLRASEERFAKAFRSNPVAISISTPENGRYLDVNDAFLDMLGYERSQVVGHTLGELNLWVDPNQRKRIVGQLPRLGRMTGIQTQLRTSQGQVREIEVAIETIELERVPCILTISRDVTEERQLQQQLQQAQKMEAIGRLAAGVAHDFNNILAVIMGYADLAKDRLPPADPVANSVTEIKYAAERAAALTRQLLTFSRQQVIHPRVLDLNVMLENVIQMLPRMLGEDVTIKVQTQPQLGSIKVDLSQIEQVLMNLAVNARDAMPRGGEIVIRTANAELDESYVSTRPAVRPGSYVMLSVSDNGCGMDAETAAHVFEPFFTTKDPGLGTGLGLSIVHGIIQQNNGHIWLYSEQGKGTIFKIYFPRTDQTPEALKPVAEDRPRGGPETILLVEDDEALRKLTSGILTEAGYCVLDSSRGDAAVRAAKSYATKIDLLLTDVIMPVMGGAEVAERISIDRPDLKVLYISGYRGDLVTEAKGAIVLLEKPFTKKSLLATVRGVLDGTHDLNPNS